MRAKIRQNISSRGKRHEIRRMRKPPRASSLLRRSFRTRPATRLDVELEYPQLRGQSRADAAPGSQFLPQQAESGNEFSNKPPQIEDGALGNVHKSGRLQPNRAEGDTGDVGSRCQDNRPRGTAQGAAALRCGARRGARASHASAFCHDVGVVRSHVRARSPAQFRMTAGNHGAAARCRGNRSCRH